MEEGLREILKSNYSRLMKNISDPHVLANNIKVLTPIDLERIQAECRERGDNAGVFELLNRLQKRGPKAFPQFIEALKDQNPGIAGELESAAKSKNLYLVGHARVDSPPNGDKRPISRGPWNTSTERSFSSPVQQSPTNQTLSEEMHLIRPHPVLKNFDIVSPADLHLHIEVNSKQTKNKGKDTLLKDIPSNLKDRMVTMLNVDSALNKNWKGIAGEIKLTAEQQGELGSLPSPMEELFKQMAYKEYRVINLVNILLKIERHDVVTEISDAGYYSQNLEESKALLNRSPSQVSEQDSSDDSQINKCEDNVDSDETLPSPTKEFRSPHESTTNTLEEKEEGTKSSTVVVPSQTQKSVFRTDLSKTIDDKEKGTQGSTVGLPSPTKESQFNSKNGTKKMDGKNPDVSNITTVNHLSIAQESEFKPTKAEEEKNKPHFSQEVEGGEENDQELSEITKFEEVFPTETMDGKAIFISCGKYRRMNKLNQLTQQVKELSRKLEDLSWNVAWIKDYESTRMKNEFYRQLHTLKRTEDACFVYLAGHTLQINGENYLLPTDIDLGLATADIMDLSLNINKLIKELSEKALMGMVIVDGGHFNEGQFENPIALPGLTAMIPPSNTVIAFPCQPGYIRSQEEMLSYVKAVRTVFEEERELSPTTLFTKVKEALNNNQSSPVEFSLSRSLLPIYLNASDEDEKSITIRKPTEDTPRHAIVFCDQNFKVIKENVETGTEHLEASLRQLGWEVEMYNNFEPKQIKEKVRRSLRLLKQDKMIVFMLYFMGYVTKDKHSIGRESRSPNALEQPNISIQWLVNMMSEYVTGPKILIVDDPSLPVRHKLSTSSALPPEVLLCLPKENWDLREEKNSFTLLLAQNLATSPYASLKNAIETSATNWKYLYVEDKLFYA